MTKHILISQFQPKTLCTKLLFLITFPPLNFKRKCFFKTNKIEWRNFDPIISEASSQYFDHFLPLIVWSFHDFMINRKLNKSMSSYKNRWRNTHYRHAYLKTCLKGELHSIPHSFKSNFLMLWSRKFFLISPSPTFSSISSLMTPWNIRQSLFSSSTLPAPFSTGPDWCLMNSFTAESILFSSIWLY